MNSEVVRACLRSLLPSRYTVEVQVTMQVMASRVPDTESEAEATLRGVSMLKTRVIPQLSNGIAEMEKVFGRRVQQPP